MPLYPRKPSVGNQLQGEPGPKPTIATRLFPAKYSITPAVGSATAVLNAQALTASTQTLTTGFTQPDFARLLRIVGNAAMTGNVVITGEDINGNVISDTIALNGTTPVNGVKAFKRITSIELPVQTAGGNTVSVGTLNTFGLPHKITNAALLLVKLFNGSADAGTLALNAALERNTYAPAGTPNGTAALELIYFI